MAATTKRGVSSAGLLAARKGHTSGLHVASLVASMRAHKSSSQSSCCNFECSSCATRIPKIEQCSVSCLYPTSSSTGSRSSQIGIFILSPSLNVVKYLLTVTPLRLYTLPTTNMPACIAQPNGNVLFNVTRRPGSQKEMVFGAACPTFVTTCAEHVLILYRINSRRDGANVNPRTIRPMFDFLADKWTAEKSIWAIRALANMFSCFIQETCYTFEFNMCSFYVLDDNESKSRTICWPWADTLCDPNLEKQHQTLELSLPKFTLGDSSTFTCLSFRAGSSLSNVRATGNLARLSKKPVTTRVPAPKRRGTGLRNVSRGGRSAVPSNAQSSALALARSQHSPSLIANRSSLQHLTTIVETDGPLSNFCPIDYSLTVANIPVCSVLHDYQEELVCELRGRSLGSLLLMCHRAIVGVCAIATDSTNRLDQTARMSVSGQAPRWKCIASNRCSLYMIPTEAASSITSFGPAVQQVDGVNNPSHTIGDNNTVSGPTEPSIHANHGQDLLNHIHFRVCGELQDYVQQISAAAEDIASTIDYQLAAQKVALKLNELVETLIKGYLYPVTKR